MFSLVIYVYIYRYIYIYIYTHLTLLTLYYLGTIDVTTYTTTDSYDKEVTESELDQSLIYTISKYR